MSVRMMVTECFQGRHAPVCKGYNGPADNPNFRCDCDCHREHEPAARGEWFVDGKGYTTYGARVPVRVRNEQGHVVAEVFHVEVAEQIVRERNAVALAIRSGEGWILEDWQRWRKYRAMPQSPVGAIEHEQGGGA